MKLSQMNTDKALEVICVISPFIESLLVDPKIKAVLENLENLQGHANQLENKMHRERCNFGNQNLTIVKE